jgi:DNA-binding FrmR family transcriptional regulator
MRHRRRTLAVDAAPVMHGSRAIRNRLRRIEGQVRGLQRLVAEDAHGVDILTQVAAVQTALEQVAIEVLDAHVHACVAEAIADKDAQAEEKIAELLDAVSRFAQRGGGDATPS